ncbi:glycosyltransferase [Cronobacter muytjensii]
MGGFKVFYTGMFRFPDIDAAGKRVQKIVNMLEMIDECENIIVGGWEQGSATEKSISDKTQHKSFSVLDKKYKSKFRKLNNFLFMGVKIIPWMITNKGRYSHIFIYNTPFLFSLVIFLLSKVLHKKVILDSTEWYESEHLVGGKYGAASLENWCRMFLAYPLFNNIIAISTYLENFYNKKRKNIIKIPPLSDQYYEPHLNDKCNSTLSFFYAGSPGKKDRLDNFVEDLLRSKTMGINLKFYIAGIDKTKFLELYPAYRAKDKVLDERFVFLGRIPMTEVFTWYAKVNYCVFFRENKRYALAGFPSKYVEAISHGIPVITNAIGDISTELKYTGINYKPTEDDIDILIDTALRNKNKYSSNLRALYEEKYSINANLDAFKEFIRLIK